jgi:hypothetical protein
LSPHDDIFNSGRDYHAPLTDWVKNSKDHYQLEIKDDYGIGENQKGVFWR